MTPEQRPVRVVAIDGPSGAGKSTVARRVAQELGWRFLDTGAMYRAVTWAALEHGQIDEGGEPLRPDGLGRFVDGLNLEMTPDQRVLVDGRDITVGIRSREVERAVSRVSAEPSVRVSMASLQRGMARHGPLVAEGRDMGTVVFPTAAFRYFLDASLDMRASRRLADFVERGRQVDLETVRDELARRDDADSSRADSPLRKADGAIKIDSDHVTADDVVRRIVADVRAADGEVAP